MAGRKSALIVATYEYDDPGLTELRAPEHDAEALAEVLGDPDVGGFDVQTVVNRPWHDVSRAVAKFFSAGRPDDLLLLHFSCHGVKDDSGELYFAARDTSLDLLEASAVGSSFVNRMMDRSRAGRILLLLDCCYAGAFARGMTAKATSTVDVNDRLGGRGRAVITASSALQYAFEDKVLTDASAEARSPSIFTRALVQGLRTGDADRNLDGWVSLDELYAFVHDEVTRVNPDQTPKKWAFDIDGELMVARRRGGVTTPSELPEPIRESMASEFYWERKAVVEPLARLLTGDHPGRALAARLALEEMAAKDDSDTVKQTARAALAAAPAAGAPPGTRELPTEPEPERDRAAEQEQEDEPEDEGPATTTDDDGGGSTWDGMVSPEVWQRAMQGMAVVMVLVLLVVVGALLFGPGGGGADEAAGDGGASVPTLPESVLLVTSDQGSGRELLAVDVETGEHEPVGESSYRLPTISPDRSWVVYLTETGEPRLMRPDGSEDQELLSPQARLDCPRTSRPAWNADGDMVALTCLDDEQQTLGIWQVDPATGELGTRVVGDVGVVGAPTWGADGRIYFAALTDGDGSPTALWSAPEGGEDEPERLTSGEEGWDSHPDWSEAGVLFLRSPATEGTAGGRAPTSGDIWVLHPDGTEEQVTTDGRVQSPTLSPDGGAAVWLAPSGADSSRMALWTAAATAEGSRELPVPGLLGPPAWGSR